MNFSKLKDFFSREDKFAKHCGIRIVSVEPGRAVAQLQVQEHHMNGARVVQGGALFTLADFAFALASNSRDKLSLAINTSMSFVKGVKSGCVTAEAIELADGPKLASYQVTLRDDEGEIVALFQGMVYRKNQKLPIG